MIEHSDKKLAYLRRILDGKVTGYTAEEWRQARNLARGSLIAGRRVMLHGAAVELLYLVEEIDDGTQAWMVKPLFVKEEEFETAIRLSDKLVEIHSKSS